MKLASIGLLLAAMASACAPVHTPTSAPVPEDAIARIDEHLGSLAEEGAFSGSALIAQGGKVLLNAGYGMADVENEVPNTPSTRFHIGSVTKQFTAVAVLILQAQRRLDPEQRVCIHLPSCPSDWEEITIHQLLTHTSGLPDSWEFYAGKNRPGVRYDSEEIIGWFEDAPLDFDPGTRFSYSNTGYQLLGYLIEEVSGQPYEVFLREHVLEPLEMTSTGYCQGGAGLAVGYGHDGVVAAFVNPSLAHSAGGLCSTVDDMHRWDQSFYTEELLPGGMIETLFTPHVSVPSFPFAPPYDETSYGYGWFVGERLGHRVAGHGGTYKGFRALIERYPDDQISIIVLSNLESSDITVTTFPSETILRGQGPN
jgi:CubicO group peptidase (beta-lactamase class C family)